MLSKPARHVLLLCLSVWSAVFGTGLICSPAHPYTVFIGAVLCTFGLVRLRNYLWAFLVAYLYVLARDSETLLRTMKIVSETMPDCGSEENEVEKSGSK